MSNQKCPKWPHYLGWWDGLSGGGELSSIKPDDLSLPSRWYLDARGSKLAPNVVFLASHAHRDTLPQSIHKQIVCLKESLTTEGSRFNSFRQILQSIEKN